MKPNSLTIKDVAQYCRVSQFAVLRWIQQGRLGAYKTASGQLLVPVQEFQAFLKTHGMPMDVLYFHTQGNPKRILVISEEDELIEFLVRSLGQSSIVIRVFSARNWDEARCQAIALKPDLIILGPKNLDADGNELRTWLRQHPAFAHTKLLAIVNANGLEEMQSYAEKGIDAVIQQPLDATVLQKKVYALLIDT
ncbi:MAG: helix-turn-helix domain-containing protein [Chloroflexi bacterium]|nr:helix-turn-helix domain-containing protein [Chloroflexota bacterium]